MPTPAPTRREFIATIAAAAGASAVHAQTPAASPWKSPVIDGHFHLRREAAANIAHMDGCGVTKAVILARDAALEQRSEDAREPAFTADFLKRHQQKLIVGSDCSCADGKGTGVAQANNPAASRLAGNCVARETLTLLQGAVGPDIFRKLVWENAHQLYRLTA